MSDPPFAAEAAASRVAQLAWSRMPVHDRLRPVRALRHLLVTRADDLCAAVGADVGRTPVEVLGSDLIPTADALKFLEQEAARLLAPRKVPRRLRPLWLWGCRDVVYRRPWGVVAVIGTWNYPVFLNAVQIAQALVAGNGVLWKPSENTPRTAELLHRLFLDAGFPVGLFQRLPHAREAGPLMADAPVDHVVFTGSDAVGQKLAARLGERLVPSTLELSGCDPVFVLADADIELAARAAWFAVVLNRGQTCIAARRVFVARERYAEFVDKLRPLAAAAKPVALQSPGQVAQAERLVADGVERGAKPLPDGPPVGPEGVRPTLLLDASPGLAVCREACFAPVAAVIPFDTVDDAVRMALECPFGLAASAFTADPATAADLAARIPAGCVTVNDVVAPTAHPATPFGGRGASGWGVTQGADGLLAMTTPQAVSVRSGRFRPHVDDTLNPDPATADLLRGMLRLNHGRGLRTRLGGLAQLVRGVRRQGK